MKNIKIKLLFAIVISTNLFISCTKDTESFTVRNSAKSLPSSIPQYASYTVMRQVIDSAYSFDSVSQLVAYETSEGRISIGRLADVFYESVAPEKFSTESDALTFYANHTNYLDTIVENNDVSIVPKWHDMPWRYVANASGYFAVGNYVYRLFKDDIVCTHENNYKDLTALTENGLNYLDTTKFYSSKPKSSANTTHTTCINSTYFFKSPTTVGNNRIILKLDTRIPFYSGIGRMHETEATAYCQHKSVGIWWTSRHTITLQASMNLHDNASYSTWTSVSRSIYVTKGSNCLTRPVYATGSPYGYGLQHYHYKTSCSLSATYPGGPTASISF